MNYETFKACESILNKIDRYRPCKVRDALFTFLEKFTNNLFTDEGSQEFSSGKVTYRTSGELTARDEFKLPEVKEPFLPAPTKPYTLVLDLDETLIHFIEFESQTAH
jgi:Dullard-like phosphatase family protein